MKYGKWMGRIGAILLCLALALSLSAIAAAAEDDAEIKDISDVDVADEPILTVGAEEAIEETSLVTVGDDAATGTTDTTVLVTIADANGALALVQAEVTVTDIDADGALTVNDALYCAHELYYEGGAAAGYAAAQSEYGLSLAKLWGTENGGSYGYYVNNAAAWSLVDPVADGDYVDAFVYTDLTAWSDAYCYFDVKEVRYDGAPEQELKDELTLSMAGFDADWNPVTLPVAGATITVNGEKTAFVTDENGQVTISLPGLESGKYVISAVSDTQTLVPPACVYTVAIEKEASEDVPETIGADKPTGSPDTGDAGSTATAIVMLGALCAAGLTVSSKRRDK